MRVDTVHSLPGRVRFRADSSLLAERDTAGFAASLSTVAGIDSARVNPRSGGILVLYDAALVSQETVRQAVIEALKALGQLKQSETSETHNPPKSKPRKNQKDRMLWSYIAYRLIRFFAPLPLKPVVTTLWAVPFFAAGVKSLASFRLDLPVVDATAVGASLALGNFKAASTLMMLLNTGAYLEAWAKQRSRENLADALSKNVDNVWVRQDGALRQIPYSELRKGDAIVLRSGSLIPIDGKVIEGRALVNEAALTGQPLVSEKTAGLLVHSGTVVQEGEIIAEVHTKGNDTSYEQTIALVEEGEGAKADIGIKANKLADKAVPFTLAFAALVFLVTRNPRKAASVLTVDYSCAIKLATPLAFLAAMREGLSNGAFFKGGASMEQFAACDTIVFGKASVLAADPNEAAQVISMLRHLGIKRIYLLSEDETSAAEKIARELSLDSYRGGLSPEDKTSMVKRLRERGCRLAFVGDGINDSPAMSAADVGIAMQDGVDLALQAADITLKESSLFPLVIARLISQRVMKRIRGNITTAIVLNSAFILLGLLENPAPGNAGSTRAAWLHNISTLILSINAMRPVLKESKQ